MRWHGRYARTPNKPTRCGAWGSSCSSPRVILGQRSGRGCWRKHSPSWAGEQAKTLVSFIVLAPRMRSASVTRPSWLRLHRMSSWCRRGGVGPMLQATRTIPVVFVNVTNPVGAGFVESLGRPGGNATGFITYEYSLSGKWLELLKQAAPHVTRAVVLRDATSASGIGQFSAVQSVAQSFGVELIPLDVRDAEMIEQGVSAFARAPNGGLIVTAGGTAVWRKVIIGLAARRQAARGLSVPLLCSGWRTDQLRAKRLRWDTSRGLLCRSHSEG